ncbi:polysaccharide export protein EpsE [Methylobacter sp.]|uniref:polysaccharide export protein EpsE n=1 Tax=Methylobacter sp. TaxID=2051955 RepID=UPI0024896645|nr:polysaccharide export protein EpsE [Methylobacter sp.]MDI1277308.1 polysaccharide export protein EpsE [Methylobacter sp.]MDI1357900.1 polysaccharide export protein EpsE [Methylobacter sp.]
MKQNFFKFPVLISIVIFLILSSLVASADDNVDYLLGTGDSIRINVFQNPELSTETRVSESGAITFPLIGEVNVGGKTIQDAEQKIAQALGSGGFVQQPQVNIVLQQVRGNQVAVLGMVNKPGRYPLETFKMHLVDALAIAGGALPNGSDVVVVTGVRNGKAFKKEVNIAESFLLKEGEEETFVMAGDQIYVHRAPVFYIYGEVQHPDSYRVERNMTVVQALAKGGGPTVRGTQRNMKLYRKDESGVIDKTSPELGDLIQADDVLYVEESLF